MTEQETEQAPSAETQYHSDVREFGDERAAAMRREAEMASLRERANAGDGEAHYALARAEFDQEARDILREAGVSNPMDPKYWESGEGRSTAAHFQRLSAGKTIASYPKALRQAIKIARREGHVGSVSASVRPQTRALIEEQRSTEARRERRVRASTSPREDGSPIDWLRMKPEEFRERSRRIER